MVFGESIQVRFPLNAVCEVKVFSRLLPICEFPFVRPYNFAELLESPQSHLHADNFQESPPESDPQPNLNHSGCERTGACLLGL